MQEKLKFGELCSCYREKVPLQARGSRFKERNFPAQLNFKLQTLTKRLPLEQKWEKRLLNTAWWKLLRYQCSFSNLGIEIARKKCSLKASLIEMNSREKFRSRERHQCIWIGSILMQDFEDHCVITTTATTTIILILEIQFQKQMLHLTNFIVCAVHM